MKRFVCIAKCPELDDVLQGHCIDTEEHIQKREERYGDYCPCGNVVKWVEVKEENREV